MKPRLIVYYLPHTEWTNVGREKPLLKEHYQPHLPTDTGFYDLRLPEARSMRKTVALSMSCKLNSIDFGDYVEDILTRIMDGEDIDESVLPNNYVTRKERAYKKAI